MVRNARVTNSNLVKGFKAVNKSELTILLQHAKPLGPVSKIQGFVNASFDFMISHISLSRLLDAMGWLCWT